MSDDTVEVQKLEPGDYLLVVRYDTAPQEVLARLKAKALQQGINLFIFRVSDVNNVRLLRVEKAETVKVEERS